MQNSYANLKDMQDENLIKKAQEGVDLAEEILLNRYKSLVLRCTRKLFIMGGDAEDLMQVGMIGLFRAIRSYDLIKNDSFKAYAYMCIMRHLLTALKAASRQKHYPLNSSLSLSTLVSEDGESTLEDLLVSTEKSPEDLVLFNDELNYSLIIARSNLSKLESCVFDEYIKGKNYLEIAKVLNKSPKSIDNAIQRIKRKLQQLNLC